MKEEEKNAWCDECKEWGHYEMDKRKCGTYKQFMEDTAAELGDVVAESIKRY